MRVYREILPNSCLLILTDSEESALTVLLLSEALQQACASGKASVWVDCSNLQQLSSTVLAVLQQYTTWLQQQNKQLVVCHPPASLQVKPSDANLMLAPSLLDAELQCRALLGQRAA
jgi:ABC-type transporter Mla MlaB component